MVRRCLVLTGLFVVLVTGCGDDPATSDAPTAALAGEPAELRVVLATDAESPPDSLVQQQFDNLDCDAPAVSAAPDQALAACDDAGVKYSLEPAATVGGIESATAEKPENQVTWVVTVDLDAAATRELADLTAERALSRLRLAVVVDGRVVAAPVVQAPVPGGQLQIAGDFTEEQATALADRLEG